MANAPKPFEIVDLVDPEETDDEPTELAHPPTESGAPEPRRAQLWSTIDPSKAVAVPGTYFGFFHGPRANAYEDPEPSPGRRVAPARGRVALWAILVLIAAAAALLIFRWP